MPSHQPAPDPIDQLPSDAPVLAAKSPVERCAAYLNMIRKSRTFFVVFALAGVILGVIESVSHS